MVNISSKKKQMRETEKQKPMQLANALPLTFIFVGLTLAVIFFEHLLSNERAQPITVVVALEKSEMQEEEFQNINRAAIDNSPEILKLTDEVEELYFSQKIKASELVTLDKLKLLSQIQVDSILIHLINRALTRKNYPAARPLFELMTAKQKQNYDLIFDYAKCLSKLDETDAAIAQYKALLNVSPKHQAGSINLGLLLLKKNQYKAVKTLYSQAITYTRGAKKARAYAGLGDAEIALNNAEKAVQNYSKSIEYRPTHALTWRKLVRAEVAIKAPAEKVIKNYKKAIELDKTNYRLLTEYGNYLYKKMQFKKAIPVLKKSLSMAKSSVNIRLVLLNSYLEKNRPLSARKQVDYLKKYANREKHKLLTLAFEDYLNGKYREALNGFKNTLKKNWDNNLSYYLVGRSYFKLKKYKNAIIYLSKVDKTSVYYNASQYRLALAYIGDNHSGEAEKLLASLFETLPETHQISYQVALLAYKKMSLETAYKAIINSLKQNAGNKKYLMLKARIEWRSVERDKALKTLKHILSIKSDYRPAIYRLADYLEQSGDKEQALITFKELLSVNRDYSNTLYRVARLQYDEQKGETIQLLLEEFLQIKSNDIRGRILYAHNFCETKQTKLCHKQIKILLKLAPNNDAVLQLNKNFM